MMGTEDALREQAGKVAAETYGYSWSELSPEHQEAWRKTAMATLAAIGIPPDVLSWVSAHPEAAKGLAEGRAKVMYREPSKAQKEAAFGPIMEGGRGGPVTSDYIRQQAAIGNYQSIWDAAND